MKPEDKKSTADSYIVGLEKKIKKSELKFEILKNAGIRTTQGKYVIFDFIQENEKKYSIRLMTDVLSIDRREYHRWKKRPLNDTRLRKLLMQKEITLLFFAFKQRYGSERIAVELRNLGYELSDRTVRKYMRELGLSARVN
ncbi:IS3 family transposase [Flavobacterium notoginsengisoli]|uniref:IS3 family transposase n=1 Tax=Flavobacterium notoginsengisoli TaxID=1478199 RepID=UPI00363CB025